MIILRVRFYDSESSSFFFLNTFKCYVAVILIHSGITSDASQWHQIQKMKQFHVLFRTHTGRIDSRTMERANRRDLSGQNQLKKWPKNACQVFLNRLESSPRIWNGGWSNLRDVNYILIENVYFSMNLKGMATINWRQNPQMFLYKCKISRQ